jgi:hypothetical protein
MESMEGLVVETELSARGPLDGRFFLKAHAELSLRQTEGYMHSLTEQAPTESFKCRGLIMLLGGCSISEYI